MMQDRERNDTIPEEPTISMDEFQSNQASFNENPINDPSTGYNTGAPVSVQGIQKTKTQFMDSESGLQQQ